LTEGQDRIHLCSKEVAMDRVVDESALSDFSRFLRLILAYYHSATVALFSSIARRGGRLVTVLNRSILLWWYFVTTGKRSSGFPGYINVAPGVFIVVLIENCCKA
jgi:hypothetical protein